MRPPTIVVAGHDPNLRAAFTDNAFLDLVDVRVATSLERAVRLVEEIPVDLLAVEFAGDPRPILRALSEACALEPDLPAIGFSAETDDELRLAALRAGVRVWLTLPPTPGQVAETVRDLLARVPDASAFARVAPELLAAVGLVGRSPAMQRVYQRAAVLARTSCNVLITGETGTGKRLVAELLHRAGPRAAGPYCSFNCGGLTESLIESELFGYEPGAFTGARAATPGLLESAGGGTLLLDEVSELPVALQRKLCEAVETKQIVRLGSTKPRTLDVRIVAATNRRLDHAVEEGRFMADLVERLAVGLIHLPPLRERPQDLPELAEHFLSEVAREHGIAPKRFSRAAFERLRSYAWPGNVRELRSVVREAAARSPSAVVGPDDLPLRVTHGWRHLPDFESIARQHVAEALSACGGNVSAAARLLGWNRSTLYRQMAACGVAVTDGRQPSRKAPKATSSLPATDDLSILALGD